MPLNNNRYCECVIICGDINAVQIVLECCISINKRLYLPADKLLRLQADDNQSGDVPLLIYGHSLSWEDSRDRVTVVNNRLRAPVWTPSVATAEDIAEMPPDPTGT